MTISASVGRAGINHFCDVVLIQGLLNEWTLEQGRPLLKVDGKMGPKTLAAITGFQQRHTRVHDGRVDPGGSTLQALIAGDADRPYRALARCIVMLCDQTAEQVPIVGMPLQPAALGILRRQVMQTGTALRPYLGVTGTVNTPVYAFAALPQLPVRPALQALGGAAVLQTMLVLLAAISMILLLERMAPQAGAAGSKLAAELEARRQVLMAAIVEHMVQFIIFCGQMQSALERCRPSNLNNLPGCGEALERARRALNNVLFKLDALKFLWNKMAAGTVPELKDFSHARQIIQELYTHCKELEAAVHEVIHRCRCGLLGFF